MTSGMDYVLGDNVGFVLRQVTQRHVGLFAALMPDQLTPTQFSALVTLRQHGPVAQTQLGRMTAMDAATIKGVVDRLVKRDVVQVDRDPLDARLIIVSLTPAGQELADRALPPARAVTEATLAPLSAGDRRMLMALLRRLT